MAVSVLEAEPPRFSPDEAAVLALEHEAILHVVRVDPDLPVAKSGPAVEADGHLVRLFKRMHGEHCGPELADDAVFDYPAADARLNLALRSFGDEHADLLASALSAALA